MYAIQLFTYAHDSCIYACALFTRDIDYQYIHCKFIWMRYSVRE
jgi:hypothetical protein